MNILQQYPPNNLNSILNYALYIRNCELHDAYDRKEIGDIDLDEIKENEDGNISININMDDIKHGITDLSSKAASKFKSLFNK